MGKKNIVGVVLAGGRSSRMRQDKALLDYNGRFLLDHMISILQQAGIADIYVSGYQEGYRCIPDSSPHEGPAYAMYDVMQHLDNANGALFIPVDMPFLSPEAIQHLVKQERSCYFIGYPLPAFIAQPFPVEKHKSVKELLKVMGVNPAALPQEFTSCMINTNTPEEWEEAVRA